METISNPSKDNTHANPANESNPKRNQLSPHIQNGDGLSNVGLFNPQEFVAFEVLMAKLMRSEKGGIKSVNEVISILLREKDLNLPFSTCIEHIHVINGKTGVDIHVIKALLLHISQAQAVIAKKKMPEFLIPSVPFDYISKYKIYRKFVNNYMISIGSFTYSEAIAAGLYEEDTYKRYARILIEHRIFTYAARDIASDILFCLVLWKPKN